MRGGWVGSARDVVTRPFASVTSEPSGARTTRKASPTFAPAERTSTVVSRNVREPSRAATLQSRKRQRQARTLVAPGALRDRRPRPVGGGRDDRRPPLAGSPEDQGEGEKRE
jgi:hypothetical protein